MVATLDYRLKDAPPELFDGIRWTVLTFLILHGNVRNRCWPSMRYMAERLNKSITCVTEAKQWLIEHGAVELVPYAQRISEEKSVPKRQHVYQLTGKLTFGQQTIPYLYIGNEHGDVPENGIESADVPENGFQNLDVPDLSHLSIPSKENTSIPKESTSPQPPSGVADAPAPKPDSVAAFGNALADPPKVAKKGSRHTNVPPNPTCFMGGGRYVGPFKSMAAAQRFSAGHGTITDLSAVPAGVQVEAPPGSVPPPGEGVLDALVGLCYPDIQVAWKMGAVPARARRCYNTLAECCGPITLDAIARFRAKWYALDFRGQKNQRPTFGQIPDVWLQLMTGEDNGSGAKGASAGGAERSAGLVETWGKPGDQVVERFPEGGFRTADGREFRPARPKLPDVR